MWWMKSMSMWRIQVATSYGESHRQRPWTVSTLAGTGTAGSADTAATVGNTAAVAAQFNLPSGVAVDSSGNLYVADTGNHRIRKIELSSPGGGW